MILIAVVIFVEVFGRGSVAVEDIADNADAVVVNVVNVVFRC